MQGKKCKERDARKEMIEKRCKERLMSHLLQVRQKEEELGDGNLCESELFWSELNF